MNHETSSPLNEKAIERFLRRALHALELAIAALILTVLLIELCFEVYRMVTIPGYFSDVDTFLRNILTIVVGLEFVRMVIDLTPGNTLEVLIMATARHIILNHERNATLLIGIFCIAVLFAVRRFLVKKPDEL